MWRTCSWAKTAPLTATTVGGIFLYGNQGSGRTAPDTISVQLQYPGDWVTTFEAQLLPSVDDGGLEFCGAEGKLYITRQGFEFTPYDRSQAAAARRGGPGRSMGQRPIRPPVTNTQTETIKAEGDLTLAHVQNFLDCMRSRKVPNADVLIGHRSAQACHLATLSYKEKKQIKFDPILETILA